ESDLSRFNYENTYEIIADVQPEIKLTGKTTLIGSKSNNGNAYPVQFTVANIPGLSIKAGMFGKLISAETGIQNDARPIGITIPATAIVGSENTPRVYLVKNGKAILQNITIYSKSKDKVFVSDGLIKDDTLITNGFINLFDSANVIIN
ncbi:MAG: hypothetical protein KBF74_02545, partial [Ferruginibacter sp.]|nr:hypothetical protein [Ferruginibacter sp.]